MIVATPFFGNSEAYNIHSVCVELPQATMPTVGVGVRWQWPLLLSIPRILAPIDTLNTVYKYRWISYHGDGRVAGKKKKSTGRITKPTTKEPCYIIYYYCRLSNKIESFVNMLES